MLSAAQMFAQLIAYGLSGQGGLLAKLTTGVAAARALARAAAQFLCLRLVLVLSARAHSQRTWLAQDRLVQ